MLVIVISWLPNIYFIDLCLYFSQIKPLIQDIYTNEKPYHEDLRVYMEMIRVGGLLHEGNDEDEFIALSSTTGSDRITGSAGAGRNRSSRRNTSSSRRASTRKTTPNI